MVFKIVFANVKLIVDSIDGFEFKKMADKFCFFVIFTLFIASSSGQNEYCYSLDETPYSFFGTKTPYINVGSTEFTIPSDCIVVQIWALIRHGSRYAFEKDRLTSEMLTTAQGEIISNHETHRRGQLCREDLELLRNWSYPWDGRLYGRITPQGKTDMENLADRIKTQFAEFLTLPTSDKFQIQTSSRSRCQESAIAFTNKLFGTTFTDIDDNNIDINNKILRANAEENAGIVELNQFKTSNIVMELLSRVTSRLGYERNLDFDFVNQLYNQCAYEKALRIGSKSPFCSAFTTDDLKIMEYCDDLASYNSLGYGAESNVHDQACPLLRDLYEKFDGVRNNENLLQNGALYFAHNEILLTLLTKLGLFHDQEPLKHDNFETLKESRLWRSSLLSPFAANFIAVMYNCSDDLTVSFYNNERLIQFPGCNAGVCLWETLRDAFSNEILKDCRQPTETGAAVDSTGISAKDDSEKDNAVNDPKSGKTDNAAVPPGCDKKVRGGNTGGCGSKQNLPTTSEEKGEDSAADALGGAAGLESVKIQIVFLTCIIVGFLNMFVM